MAKRRGPGLGVSQERLGSALHSVLALRMHSKSTGSAHLPPQPSPTAVSPVAPSESARPGHGSEPRLSAWLSEASNGVARNEWLLR